MGYLASASECHVDLCRLFLIPERNIMSFTSHLVLLEKNKKNCRLPVGYYFTKCLTREQLELLALKGMKSVEEAGFQVVRLVANNRSTNCKFFFASLSGGRIRPVVTSVPSC